MSAPITVMVSLPPESQAYIKNLTDKTWVPQAVKRGMDRALTIVRGRIQEQRLSGKGPYPVDEGRLGERSSVLRQAVREEPAVISGNTVTGAIGVNVTYQGVNYAAVHEFSGATVLPVRSRYLVYKIGDQLIFSTRSVIPVRAPITRGVEQDVDYIAEEIDREIQDTGENL